MISTRKVLFGSALLVLLLSAGGAQAMGMRVSSIGSHAQRVLWLAATRPNIVHLKELLSAHVVDPNFRVTVYDGLAPEVSEQITPLMAAVVNYRVDVVKAMLASSRVDVNHNGLTKEGVPFRALDCAAMEILRTKTRINAVLAGGGDPSAVASPGTPGMGRDLYSELGKQELLADLLHNAGGTNLLMNGDGNRILVIQ